MVELFDDGVVVVRCNSLRFSNFDVMVARAFASGYGVGIVLPLTNRLPFLPTWRISNVLIADKTKFVLSKLLSMPCLKYVFGIFLEIISSRRQCKKKSRVWHKLLCVCVCVRYEMRRAPLMWGVLSHSVAYNFYLTTFCFQNILDSVVVLCRFSADTPDYFFIYDYRTAATNFGWVCFWFECVTFAFQYTELVEHSS